MSRDTTPLTVVIALGEIADEHAGLVGPKALSLARLMRIGLTMPGGFCVTGSAYRAHVGSDELAKLTASTVKACRAATAQKRAALLTTLRESFTTAQLASRTAYAVEERFASLRLGSTGRVAVRSSATAEDLPGHSFAGQHDTYLGLADVQDCMAALKRCWASLWTDRAFAYREENDIDHLDVDMAVVVQVLVNAEASGVMFTVDPVSGERERIVIESSFGLGEAIVSGRVTPDRFVFQKKRLKLVTKTISQKTFEIVVSEGGTVEQRDIPGERGAIPSIDEKTARGLAKLGLKAERAFGGPQDMEWALAGKRLYVLQSRPVTTLGAGTLWEDGQIWTNANTGEVMPDVATPFSWSCVQFMLDAVFGRLFGALGFDMKQLPLVGLVAGRVYFNVNMLIAMVRSVPFSPGEKHDVTKVLGGRQEVAERLGSIDIAEEDIPEIDHSLLAMLFRMPGLAMWFVGHSPLRAGLYLAAKRKKTRALLRLDVRRLSDDALAQKIVEAADDMTNSASALAYPIVAMTYFVQLDRFCRAFLDDRDGVLVRQLVMGLPGMQPAEAGIALWRMAAFAHARPDVARAITKHLTFSAAAQHLRASADGAEFLSLWDEFMAEHGHHSRGELEYANARWAERPDDVLAMVRGYVEGIENTDPAARQRDLALRRLALTGACRARLRNPLKRIAFDFLLKRAQLGSVARENTKSEAVRRMYFIRLAMLEVGRRLVERGALSAGDDVFNLTYDEVPEVLAGRATFDVADTVARRAAEYEKNLTITPPAVVVGRFDPNRYEPDPVDTEATTLTGMGASAGVVEGPARVILRSGTGGVKPGEILVAPFTDPGWTPYFVNAAGIVVDMGGMLSHGSIIAREYGIPAVVNVGPATKIIKTGQRLRVDGDTGVVTIL